MCEEEDDDETNNNENEVLIVKIAIIQQTNKCTYIWNDLYEMCWLLQLEEKRMPNGIDCAEKYVDFNRWKSHIHLCVELGFISANNRFRIEVMQLISLIIPIDFFSLTQMSARTFFYECRMFELKTILAMADLDEIAAKVFERGQGKYVWDAFEPN